MEAAAAPVGAESPNPRPWLWQKGKSGNPGGRKRGEVFISEAVKVLLRGDPPTSSAPVWDVAANVLRALRSERLDSRVLSLVLERLEGKVPDKLEATINQGVVLLPVGRLEADAWGRLASATLAPRDAAIDAEVVATARSLAAREAEPDEDAEPDPSQDRPDP